MSLKKIFLGLACLGVFAFIASPVGAMTISELQAQIAQLMSQIAALQQQLQQQQGNQWCYAFNTNLKIGDTGNDVTALQTSLKNAGFDIGDDTSGTFGEGTASAVVGLQEKYASEVLTPVRLTHGNGFVGKLTRGKLNKLFGCSKPCTTNWELSNNECKSVTHCGEWMTLNYQGFATEADCKASLNKTECKIDSDCPQARCGDSSTRCIGGVVECSNGKCVSVSVNCPAVCIPLWRLENNFCVFHSCESGCDRADNKTSFGTEADCKASLSEQKSITVTSPNGGENWQVGKTYDISWKSTGVDKINIFILGYQEGAYTRTTTTIATNVPAPIGKYSWTIDFPFGSMYIIRIIDSSSTSAQKLIYDNSDNNFSIVSPSPKNLDGGQCNYKPYSGTCTITNVDMPNSSVSFKFSPNITPMDLKGTWADISGQTALFAKGFQEYPGYLNLSCLNGIYPITINDLNKCNVVVSSVFNCNLNLITNGTCSPEGFNFFNLLPNNLDSVLYQLTQAGNYQDFATQHGLSIVDNKVRVIIELNNTNYVLPVSFGTEETRYQNLLQALVPIDKLLELANDSNIKLIRVPITAGTTMLDNTNNQLASIANALTRLIENVKDLLK